MSVSGRQNRYQHKLLTKVWDRPDPFPIVFVFATIISVWIITTIVIIYFDLESLGWTFPIVNNLALFVMMASVYHFREYLAQLFFPKRLLIKSKQRRKLDLKNGLQDMMVFDKVSLEIMILEMERTLLNTPFFRVNRTLYFFNKVNDLRSLYVELLNDGYNG
ncbi:MAG: hypothetical protein AAGA43_15670 [Bacteroidota bacterium]